MERLNDRISNILTENCDAEMRIFTAQRLDASLGEVLYCGRPGNTQEKCYQIYCGGGANCFCPHRPNPCIDSCITIK